MTLQKVKSIASAKNLFFALAAAQLVFMLLYSFSAGISADEYRHYHQAAKVYKYYQTKGENTAALENTGIDPMQYNGQSFDNVMYVIEKWFKIDNYMELRHFFNALTGWLVIFIAGLVMKEILGYRAAIFVLLSLFFTPRFFGHALNNNKDIPFAMGFILTIYGNILLLKQLPKPKWTTYLWLVLGIGLSISIRMAGILNIFFVGFSLGLYYLANQPLKDFAKPINLKLLYRIIIIVIGSAILGFIIGVAFWPFVTADPVKNTKEIFAALSSHPVSLNQTFNGIVYNSKNIPWYYTITYITITYPLYVLVGLLASIFTLYSFRKRFNLIQVVAILFPWIFVVFWMSYKNSNVYGVIRHITFIYPLAVISAVLFFYTLFEIIKEKKNQVLKYVLIGLIAILSWHSVFFMVKNLRYSYIYYNECIGGLKNAYGDFETDYFYHSIREASLWLRNEIKNNKDLPTDRKIIVASNHLDPTRYYFRNDTNVKNIYIRYYQRGEKDWDYAIIVNSYIEPYQVKKKIYPPSNTIHTVDVNDKPICAILKRKTKDDLVAWEYMKKNNYPMAIRTFESVVKKDPKYDWAWLKLMECYYNTRNFSKVIETGNNCLRVYKNEQVMVYVGLAYLNTNQVEYGIMTFNRMLKEDPGNATAYFYAGIAYSMKQDLTRALSNLLKSIELNSNNPQAYKIVGDIYQQQNNKDMAQKYYQTYNAMVQ